MNRIDFTVVAIRLLIVYAFCEIVSSLTVQITTMFENDFVYLRSDVGSYVVMIVPLIVYVILIAILWFKAESLAKIILPRNDSDEPKELVSSNLTHEGVLNIGLVLMGTYLAVPAIIAMIGSTYMYFAMDLSQLGDQTKNISISMRSGILIHLLKVLVGFYIIIGSRKIINLFKVFRKFDQRSVVVDNNDTDN